MLPPGGPSRSRSVRIPPAAGIVGITDDATARRKRMNKKILTLAALAGIALFAGCAKKAPPPPPAEPPPPPVEAPAAPVVEAPKVDEAAERRARIQARIGETFRTIYFAFDQSTLSAEGKAIAEGVASLMQEAPRSEERRVGKERAARWW